ncbi:MAG TPA: endonuclease/exonuclease/phosphatase family protein [Thermoleophilaceae bacterium]|nr:endonuclease/exonuclease/phosphatase family protein [Thermoleophilaceae bacterium]
MLLASGVPAANAAQVPSPSNSLQVWNLNTHGMDTGIGPAPNDAPTRSDYRDFISYIIDPSRVAYYPDLITLQETGTNDGGITTTTCNEFAWLVHAGTNRPYLCVETTKVGGAAIVYRSDRLALLASNPNVQVKRIVNEKNQSPGETLGSCLYKGWYALVLLMQDTVNSKYLAAESVHLPNSDYTTASGTQDCAWENTQIVNQAVANSAVKMQVMAGDWNALDATATGANEDTFTAWRCWYQGTNAAVGTCSGPNLGWRDGFYDRCPAGGASVKYSCLHTGDWTYIPSTVPSKPHRRIDFLFARGSLIQNAVTVGWPEALASATAAGNTEQVPSQYSDHRGQGALISYNP